ncbi:MAG: hypothetical protein CMI71_03320 [Candidatus Pelagibacter sp.]|nr:hypothetical protein [Candidatus Pelagibacter sp.]OUW78960.1 MAG: hypothetical protein CBD77_03585 [bacterium TMED217]
MQLKFNRQKSLGESLIHKMIKLVLLVFVIIFLIFLLDKFNFPSPKKNIQKDITNEIIKLK